MSHLSVISLRVIFVVGESEVWHMLDVIRCDNQNRFEQINIYARLILEQIGAIAMLGVSTLQVE